MRFCLIEAAAYIVSTCFFNCSGYTRTLARMSLALKGLILNLPVTNQQPIPRMIRLFTDS